MSLRVRQPTASPKAHPTHAAEVDPRRPAPRGPPLLMQVAPNPAAREKLHKVQALMGPSYLDAASFVKDATEQETVRRAQARLAAEDADKAGDAAMRAGDPSKAIEHYRQAEMILRYHPLIATG